MRDAEVSARPPTREAILDAALTALAANPGAALGAIAERAGVGRATLHRHFPARADLVRELALMSVREIDNAVAGLEDKAASAIELLELIVEAVIPLGDRYHFLAREAWLESDPAIEREITRQTKSLWQIIEQCKHEGAIDVAVPSAWVVGALDALIYTSWSLAAEGHIAPKQSAALVLRTLLSGVASAPADTTVSSPGVSS